MAKAGVGECLGLVYVVSHKWHVGDDQRLLGAPDHGFGMVQNVIHRHLDRGLVAQHHHAKAVANQEHRYPGLIS